MSPPDYVKIYQVLIYGWQKGLKTGLYYLRTKPSAQAIAHTVKDTATSSGDAQLEKVPEGKGGEEEESEENCLMCSS